MPSAKGLRELTAAWHDAGSKRTSYIELLLGRGAISKDLSQKLHAKKQAMSPTQKLSAEFCAARLLAQADSWPALLAMLKDLEHALGPVATSCALSTLAGLVCTDKVRPHEHAGQDISCLSAAMQIHTCKITPCSRPHVHCADELCQTSA